MKSALLLCSLAAASLVGPPAAARQADAPIPVLVVSGKNNHWWQWTTPSLVQILEESGKFSCTVTNEPEATFADADALARYRAFVLDYNANERWPAAAEQNFLAAVRGGTGVSVIHAADNAFPGWVEYETLVALLWREGTGHGRFHAFDVTVTDRDHPITRDLPDLRAHRDELYHRLVHLHDAPHRVLATAHSSKESGGTGADEPMVIVSQYGQGRVFHTPLGHVWGNSPGQQISHTDPQFRDLVVRGTEWAATGQVTPDRRVNALTPAERAAGWELLFDGRTAAGWRGYRAPEFPEQGWQIEDGALRCVAGGGGGDLVTEAEFADFELAFQWKVAPGANSGVMARVAETQPYPWQSAAEYQVLDDAGNAGADPRHRAAACYDLIAPEGARPAPTGAWNEGRILVVGDHVEHWLNGVQVVEYDMASPAWAELVAGSKFADMPEFARPARGRIALQDHGNDVWYRDLRVRRLDFDPARKVALFDGRSLAGWTAFLRDDGRMEDVWSVTDDGVLVCKGRPIGYLRTEAGYDNFVLRLAWRFDPAKGAGNSGVLLRKTGPDKVWPRSIEAQLQSGAAGDFWNIDAYPMVAAAERTDGRNTRRTATNEEPLGEWNQYEITLWHGHCVLRVNGQILNQARDCMELAGPICLQSEGAEIHFRDVELTPLR